MSEEKEITIKICYLPSENYELTSDCCGSPASYLSEERCGSCQEFSEFTNLEEEEIDFDYMRTLFERELNLLKENNNEDS